MNRKEIAATLAVGGSILTFFAIGAVAMIIRTAVGAIGAAALADQSPQAASAIIGEAMIQITVVSLYAIPAFLLLTATLVYGQYRASWFLWFVRLCSVLLLFVFPVGSLFAIFFLTYSFHRRHEFRRFAQLPTVA